MQGNKDASIQCMSEKYKNLMATSPCWETSVAS